MNVRPIISAPPPRMSVAEFLDWPGDGVTKTWQLFDGEVRPLSPAAATHGLLQVEISYLLVSHIRRTGSPLFVATEAAVSPRMDADHNLRVPDIAICEEPIEAGQVIFPDPLLLVEILSPGNKADTRQNVIAYASIPTLREVVLVESTRIRIELFRRDSFDAWPPRPTKLGAGDTLTLESIGFSCPVLDLYARTHLARKAR